MASGDESFLVDSDPEPTTRFNSDKLSNGTTSGGKKAEKTNSFYGKSSSKPSRRTAIVHSTPTQPESDGSEILAYDSEVSEEVEDQSYQSLIGLNELRMNNVPLKEKTLTVKELLYGKRSNTRTSQSTGTASISKSTPARPVHSMPTGPAYSTPARSVYLMPARPTHIRRKRLPDNSAPSGSSASASSFHESGANRISAEDDAQSDEFSS